ncbi:hypothetical protein P2Q00_06380 [Streptomyces coacervatus]|uniref:hypothetical protein n=1 Tax=Streptomyces coacervatus TaxID=647381 RepID=UPI0023D9EA7B|nr:hypothetical protein [Streptomyces coacervatus]MDF2265070.1 hypothetical protein [Streptomyces coacervatus]
MTLAKKTVGLWLSAFGKRVQQQTVTPGGSLDLGATQIPTPVVPTHTASGDDDTDCKRVRCIALTFDDGPAAPARTTAAIKAATGEAPTLFAQTVIDKAKRNDVVLMHDIHPTSVAAVPQIPRTLTARGFHFVTVSHLRATL